MIALKLAVLDGRYAVWRLPAGSPSPTLPDDGLLSITRTRDEVSVVSRIEGVPEGVESEPGWVCLAVAGPLDFQLTGILLSLALPLADAGISIFAISTFDTDYLLIKASQLNRARTVLEKTGHRFVN